MFCEDFLGTESVSPEKEAKISWPEISNNIPIGDTIIDAIRETLESLTNPWDANTDPSSVLKKYWSYGCLFNPGFLV